MTGGEFCGKDLKAIEKRRKTMVGPRWSTRIPPLCLIAVHLVACPAWGQKADSDHDVQKGRDLAVRVCGYCHVAARDQPFKPILKQPAPSFESIAQRKTVSADWITAFLATTHRGLDRPKSMPSPQLLDRQRKQVAAYILSLRKSP